MIDLYEGQFDKALEKSQFLSQKYPKSPVVLNIYGAVLQSLRHFDRRYVFASIHIQPDFLLQQHGSFLTSQYKTTEACIKALAAKPDLLKHTTTCCS